MTDVDRATEDAAEKSSVPATIQKPSLTAWLETMLPFQLPRIPLPQTAKNLDKAVARLINVGTDRVAVGVEASTQKKTAITKAELAYIGLGTGQIVPGINNEQDRQALSYVLEEAKLSNSNRKKVIEEAVNDLTHNPIEGDAPSILSDDWLNTFAGIASDKSDADIQRLWGKILSGEIRRPGSVKLRTLASLSTFDKDDAHFAHFFLSHTVGRQWILNDYFVEVGLYENMLRARELGIISDDNSITYSTRDFPDFIHVANGAKILVRPRDTEVITILPVSSLTSLGLTLYGFLDEPVVERKYLEMLAECFRRGNFDADFATWGRQRVAVTI